MSFSYQRTIPFRDTDAAGVVYFANVLNLCHEAYEASLSATGISLREFFQDPEVAVPIVHAAVDFFQPLFCGDTVVIQLLPKQLAPNRFEINYLLFREEQQVAKATTRHVCINPVNRTTLLIPVNLRHWLQLVEDGLS